MQQKKATFRLWMHALHEPTVEFEVPDDWDEMSDGEKWDHVEQTLFPNGVEADVLDPEDVIRTYEDGDYVNHCIQLILDNLEEA